MIENTSNNILAFGFPGWQEILIILVIVLILFGGRKLPELARGLGKGLRVFKQEFSGVKKEVQDIVNESEEDMASSESSHSQESKTTEI